MVAISANVSRLKPEIRLAQAVSQFEADLSNKQKTAFRTFKSQSLNSPADPSDVMRLTAEIDRQVSRKVGGRCVGPRFTNFLQGNIIACSVWSLLIVSFSSYVEKLSTLFMDIGRSAPRYQKMALLYPQSRSLQSQLCEYFIVAVCLCHHLFKLTKKPTFRQVTSTLNDSDLKTFQTELDRWANSIKEEIVLIEAQESSRFRALSSKLSKSAVYQQKLATNLRVLDFCSKYDHETTWKQTRKVGKAALFAPLAEYQAWKDYSSSCTLLYTGKLGSGKSVLLANIVDDLNIHAKNDTITSLKARTILGSLARQLLCTIPDLAMVAEICEETRTTEDTERILKLICRGFPSGHKAYFILDGLDECEHVEREMLRLQLLISFRVEPNIDLESITKRLAVTRIASIPEDNPDIKAFIKAELERDPTLILDIQDALLNGSQGMFLWVALQIQSLCDMKTDQAIRDALTDLPKDLSETFSRILHNSRGSGQSYQTQILQLILAAYRPLTADELREALSVVPGDTIWTPSRLLNDVYSALACCGCLLTVDEEETTVRFVHHSVKRFLLNGSNASSNIAFTAEKAQREMADIIVTYLSYVPPVMIQSATSSVIRAAIGSSSIRPDFNISKTLAEARTPFQSRPAEEFCFYSYATAHWLHHIFYVSGREMAMHTYVTVNNWTSLAWAAENGNEAIVKLVVDSVKVNTNSTDQSGSTPLWWAFQNRHEAVVKLLLDTGKVDVNLKDQNGQTPLFWAAKNRHEAVVKLLLDTGKVDVNLKDQNGQTPLCHMTSGYALPEGTYRWTCTLTSEHTQYTQVVDRSPHCLRTA
ncbi:hypothetical protein K458DRAFT_447792 [Lentithecium fluviatile CBS 122367]|uniref:Uncharacterized protein n=1 Tax=Lentithecium fluviatile CBS 122367 TaxID=1168545 RepID=A0A6G1ICI2_9PLEO|nr:hypothetical protein K458DRAFT_447792 [Lentithecium fluviatile CBS 122367]